MRLRCALFLICVSLLRADNIAVNNASLVAGLSPFNWERSGSSYIRTANPGAYFKVNFTGTTFGVVVDVSSISGAGVGAIRYPQLKWAVDGGSSSTRQLASGDTTLTLTSGLADTTHSIVVYVLSTDADSSTSRWDGTMSVKITSIVVGTSKTLSAATLQPNGKALFYGDSITEGAWILGAPNSPSYSNYSTYEESTLSWAVLLAASRNVEYGQCAFGGQGWDSGYAGVPAFSSAWNYILSGVSRDFTGCNLVVINMGQNGGVSSASTVTTFLTNLRAALVAAGSTAQVFIMVPFNGNTSGTARTNITSGYNTYIAGAPSDLTYLVDLGTPAETISSANSWDGVHLNTTGQALEFALLSPSITYQFTRLPGQPGRTAMLLP